ncbi:hypothetical protein KH172YL63_07220 [Bacillus sp. KH172YL63]|nr:hypothetical protein KH172YL63_07220 [Bacillus sp. KH172YL63]
MIWVKNRSHLEDGRPYFSQSTHLHEEGDAGEIWVKMSVEDALERKRRWKENHADIPQWITECYLMGEHVTKLVFPESKEKVMEFWLSKT